MKTNIHKELYETYKDLYETACEELRFANTRCEILRDSLSKIDLFTKDNLVKWLIENIKKRDDLDKLIHSRLLFDL